MCQSLVGAVNTASSTIKFAPTRLVWIWGGNELVTRFRSRYGFPVHTFQFSKLRSYRAADCIKFVDFRKTVCHGVPRCTLPNQPMLGNLLVGKSQSSDRITNGSL